MLGRLRALVTPWRQGLAKPLVRAGIRPDVLTLAAIPLAAGAAMAIISRHPVLGFVLACLAVLVDLVDGEVARLTQRTSPFGNCLDAIVDRVVEGMLLVALAPASPLAASTALLGCVLVSYIKARVGLVIVSDNQDWPGVGDRSDRVVLILLAVLLSTSAWRPWNRPVVEVILWALAALCAVACLQRLVHALHLVRQAERSGGLLPYLQEPSAASPPPPTS